VARTETYLAYRVIVYYLVTFAGLFVLGNLFPETQQFISGGDLVGSGEGDLQQTLQNGAAAATAPQPAFRLFNDQALALLIALCSTVLFTVPLAWTFGLSHPHEQHSSIRETIFLLPITVASVVVIVQHSIALAFSLAGIVAAVRFRSNIKTPADAMFVFAALAIGLAAGVSEIGVAGIGSMFFCLTYIVLRISGVVLDAADVPATAVAPVDVRTAAVTPSLPVAGTDMLATTPAAQDEALK
jgi:hypothetical protein